MWVKISLLDHDYEVASFSSVQGALSLLARAEHDLMYVNADELEHSLPGLFGAIARRKRPLGVVVHSPRPEALTRAFADVADGSLGGSPITTIAATEDQGELLGALRRIERKLRWRRATGEIEAVAAPDGRVWR